MKRYGMLVALCAIVMLLLLLSCDCGDEPSNGDNDEECVIVFEENWDSGEIDTSEWGYVDPYGSGGHKTSIVDAELRVNGSSDLTYGCGIIAKTGYTNNTKLTVVFRFNYIGGSDNRGFIHFRNSGERDEDGRPTGNRLFGIFVSPDTNHYLFIGDSVGNYYPLVTSTVLGQYYSLEINFNNDEAQFTTGDSIVVLPFSYSHYHIYFGGHLVDCYYDNLDICEWQ